MALIVDTFNAGQPVNDFCAAVSYEDIEQNKLSFSAGQYFEVKIEYVELTQEEFNQKMNGAAERIIFRESPTGRRNQEAVGAGEV
jgi:type I restriction enzyme M protein